MEAKIQVNTNKEEMKELKDLPNLEFRSDWFKCTNCGHTVRMLAYGDYERCQECGGTMVRC